MTLDPALFSRAHRRRRAAPLLGAAALGILSAALLQGCGNASTQAASAPSGGAAPAAAAPPPPAVTVAHPVVRHVVQQDEYAGHLASPELVELQARVSGLVVAAPIQEGAMVKKGDLLFAIDDRPFKATLDARIADVARAESQEALTAANFKRLDKIHGTRAISEEDYDTAKANHLQAIAAVAGAKAALETAQLNFDWTRVVSPITGRVGRKIVTVGNLVNSGGGGANSSGGSSGGQGTMLTTIVSIDPMYCYVDVPEEAFLRYQAVARQKTGQAQPQIACRLGLANEAGFPHQGVIDFTDNVVDPRTGTVVVRGVFKNADALMTPGLSTRMQIPGSAAYDAVLVPDMAIGTSQSERFVLVVGPDDTVAQRAVKLGALFGDQRAITSGLKADDLVIVNGAALPMVHPGGKVSPKEAAPAGSADAKPEADAPGAPKAEAHQ